MTDLVGRALNRLGQQLRGRLSMPGDDGYDAATAIWAKPVGRVPRAIVHCRSAEDVQLAIRVARNCDLPPCRSAAAVTIGPAAPCARASSSISARMNAVVINPDEATARVIRRRHARPMLPRSPMGSILRPSQGLSALSAWQASLSAAAMDR